MPTAPSRPCRRQPCPELVPPSGNGYCDAHQAVTNERLYDRWRGTAASRGYDRAWQRVRLRALKRDQYLCQECLRQEHPTAAVDVDHIAPLHAAPDLRLDMDNLQSLCRACHRAKTERDRLIPVAVASEKNFLTIACRDRGLET